MNIVLDTNVLVSAVWSPGRNASNILNAVFAGKFSVCYDYRILEEYERVLRYPKLKFQEWEINAILDPLIKNGISVVPDPLPDVSKVAEISAEISEVPFSFAFERDETDKKFYEVAKYCHAILISGNLAHFPKEPEIMSPADFCKHYLNG